METNYYSYCDKEFQLAIALYSYTKCNKMFFFTYKGVLLNGQLV